MVGGAGENERSNCIEDGVQDDGAAPADSAIKDHGEGHEDEEPGGHTEEAVWGGRRFRAGKVGGDEGRAVDFD